MEKPFYNYEAAKSATEKYTIEYLKYLKYLKYLTEKIFLKMKPLIN
ncbi:hypothetical protein OFR41_10895 [Brachyspira hyodysenteriae]|nr:hypothetical protein [Brachyspira hyodysenteriae]MCZ9887323.1 hypothetical protein [Brachyspira hyodysenteriae]MCZ9939783.1 hypothetical protein [Brachyspira hyodysenteriae]MDA0035612.1 hypothetical protein [Brachyspira hyodysenteriae]MDA0049697.1 hypothetical protein [Brachyspira hyodysenteriae]MDA0063943.1 hypothetical protein [Brachyspira hyodysenteriae]